MADFSLEIIKAKRQVSNIFEALKDKITINLESITNIDIVQKEKQTCFCRDKS